MTFQVFREQIDLLEKCLKQTHTYEEVLALKNDITKLIIAFNELDKSSIHQSFESLNEIKMSIQNIREQYKIKIQALKNPRPYPVALYSYDVFMHSKYNDVYLRHEIIPAYKCSFSYENLEPVYMRVKPIQHRPILKSLESLTGSDLSKFLEEVEKTFKNR